MPPFGLVIFVDINWDETNQPHRLACELLTDDGQPVLIPGPVGDQPLRFEAQVEAGRPPGTIHGTAARWPLTVNMAGGLPLDPGRYEWRVTVEGFPDATAMESFQVFRHPATVHGETDLPEP